MSLKNKFKKTVDKEFENVNVKEEFEKFKNNAGLEGKNSKIPTLQTKFTLVLNFSFIAVLALGIGIYFLVSNLNKPKIYDPETLVSIDVNPSIKFTVDKNNVCTSISGENNEGKLIILENEFVGKDLDEIIDLIIEEEKGTGYLISGNVDSIGNTISFSISSEYEDTINSLKIDIENYITEKCKESNINATINYVSNYAKSDLIDYILTFDTSKTENELNELSYNDLLKIINDHYKETVTLYSVELEELYNQAKNYEINFVESEETKEIIESLGDAYSYIVSILNTSLDSLQNSIDYINNYRYELFIKDNSTYQKTLSSIKDLKKEIINLRDTISNTSTDSALRDQYIEILNNQISALETSEENLSKLKDSYNQYLETSIASIQKIIDGLHSVINNLPDDSEITKALTSRASEIENKINQTKNSFFNEFEENYKEIINSTKDSLLEYKNTLKSVVSN